MTKASDAVDLVIAEGVVLWRDRDQEPWATVTVGRHHEHHPIGSRAFRRFVERLYYGAHDEALGQARADALHALEAQAVAGPVHPVHLRLAELGGAVFLDLGDSDWRVVEVDARGWRVLDESPIRFWRPAAIAGIPAPVAGGCIDDLAGFLNVAAESDEFRLVVAFLVASLRPQGPFPLLHFTGEQGSAKSTAARAVRSLVDPNRSPLRAEPRDVRDVLVAARHSWMPVFDNVSSLPAWLSDALCRLSTGGGLSTRQLYTDGEEYILDATRPAIVTGITEVTVRGDLADRALLITLPAIRERNRRTERELWAAFELSRPGILGALLTAVSVALRDYSTTRLSRPPRMADFATWATAAESGLGWKPGTFMGAYVENLENATRVVLESAPIARHLRDLTPVTATVGDLLHRLNDRAAERERAEHGWPGSPRALRAQLTRLAPALRRGGVDVVVHRRTNRGTIVELSHITEGAEDRHDRHNAHSEFDWTGSERDGSDGVPSAPGETVTPNRDRNDGSDGSDGLSQPVDSVDEEPWVAALRRTAELNEGIAAGSPRERPS